MPKKSTYFRFRIEPELREQITQRAKAENMPTSQLVRKAMRFYLVRSDVELDGE